MAAFVLGTLTAQAQDGYVVPEKPRYLGKGRVLYEGRTLNRPNEISRALVESSPDVDARLRSYRTLYGVSNALGYVGGFGLGYGLSSVLTQNFGNRQRFGPGLLIGGIGAFGLGLLLQSQAHRALSQAIDLYNQPPAPTLLFVPLLGRQNGQTTVGVAMRF